MGWVGPDEGDSHTLKEGTGFFPPSWRRPEVPMPSTLCSMAPFPLSESLGSGIRPGKTCDAIVS